MKFIKAVLLICTIALSLSAYARTPVPIVNYDNIVISTTSGKPVEAEQVKHAISSAAAEKGWTISSVNDGSLLATLVVRNKHTIVVKVDYDNSKYAITYHDSTNMKYRIVDVQQTIVSSPVDQSRNGQAEIHPFYNKWVQDFKDEIRKELLKL